jgi:mRNA interferase HigB
VCSDDLPGMPVFELKMRITKRKLKNYLVEPLFLLDFFPKCIHNVYVRIAGKLKLQDFWNIHPRARTPLERWIKVVENAEWSNWADLKSTFRTADSVRTGTRTLVVFNVGGNKYRLVTAVNYKGSVVILEVALTHREYDAGRWKG